MGGGGIERTEVEHSEEAAPDWLWEKGRDIGGLRGGAVGDLTRRFRYPENNGTLFYLIPSI